MSDEQVIAVFRCLHDSSPGDAFNMTADECRAALLAEFPGHATVEAIFESGALSLEWRTDSAYPMFNL